MRSSFGAGLGIAMFLTIAVLLGTSRMRASMVFDFETQFLDEKLSFNCWSG